MFSASFGSIRSCPGVTWAAFCPEDWPKFSIKWPESSVGTELYDFLKSLPAETLEEMKARRKSWVK